jgi:hypothetical protein
MKYANALCGDDLVCLNVESDFEALTFLLVCFLTKCISPVSVTANLS